MRTEQEYDADANMLDEFDLSADQSSRALYRAFHGNARPNPDAAEAFAWNTLMQIEEPNYAAMGEIN